MSTRALARPAESMPAIFDNFFTPWNEWFENGGIKGRMPSLPSVNIAEHKDEYRVSLAAPGLKKDDFNIQVDGNMLTISSEKEESKDDRDKKFTRREYNYSSFSRSFTLPDEVNKEKIEAKYEDGVLVISLPRKPETAKSAGKHIQVK